MGSDAPKWTFKSHFQIYFYVSMMMLVIFILRQYSSSKQFEHRLTFWLNLHSSKHDDFHRFFSKSWRIFGNFSILIQIVIENNEQQIALTKNLIIPFAHSISKMDDFPNTHGYFGQMLEPMINPQKHIQSEYVGFVDTDTFWVAFPTEEELFQNEKPVIIAQTGYADGITVWGWLAPKQTFQFLKEKESLRCMSMWPLIFKVEHLVEMKNYIESIHNQTILEIFKREVKFHHQMTNSFFQHFNIVVFDRFSYFPRETRFLLQGHGDVFKLL